MSKPDVFFECREADTAYRVAPNPEVPPGTGFKHGATLEWSDDGGAWGGHFFIAPEALEAIGLALLEAAKDVKE